MSIGGGGEFTERRNGENDEDNRAGPRGVEEHGNGCLGAGKKPRQQVVSGCKACIEQRKSDSHRMEVAPGPGNQQHTEESDSDPIQPAVVTALRAAAWRAASP